jgi:hypothetical protein
MNDIKAFKAVTALNIWSYSKSNETFSWLMYYDLVTGVKSSTPTYSHVAPFVFNSAIAREVEAIVIIRYYC